MNEFQRTERSSLGTRVILYLRCDANLNESPCGSAVATGGGAIGGLVAGTSRIEVEREGLLDRIYWRAYYVMHGIEVKINTVYIRETCKCRLKSKRTGITINDEATCYSRALRSTRANRPETKPEHTAILYLT